MASFIPRRTFARAEALGGLIGEHHIASFAAALAFRGLFAIVPSALLLVSLLGVFDAGDALNELLDRVDTALPQEAVTLLRDQVLTLSDPDAKSAFTIGAVTSALLALWAISGAFRSVMEAMNLIYRVPETRGRVATYRRSLTLALLTIALFLSALVLVVAGPGIARWISDTMYLGDSFVTAWTVLQWPVLLVFVLVGFGTIYRLAPAVRQRRRVVSGGALIATVAWLAFSLLFSLYANSFGNFNKTYGALAGIMVFMLYLYYSAFVLLVGAELNRLLGHYTPHATLHRRSGDGVP